MLDGEPLYAQHDRLDCRLTTRIYLAESETAEHKEKLRLAEEVRLAEREAAEVCVWPYIWRCVLTSLPTLWTGVHTHISIPVRISHMSVPISIPMRITHTSMHMSMQICVSQTCPCMRAYAP